MTLILAFLAGLLTLINPCVLPVLPIVLASALQAHRFGPVALAAGMAASFVSLGMLFAVAGQGLGISQDRFGEFAALAMAGFGLVLLVPRLNAGFALATAGLTTRADRSIDALDRGGLGGQALGGALLGAVWSPCVGPTLGGAISLASQGQNLGQALAIMTAFAAGVAGVMLALAYGARAAILRRRNALRKLAERARPLMGWIFLLTGLALFFHVNLMIEGFVLNHMPIWLQDLTVSL